MKKLNGMLWIVCLVAASVPGRACTLTLGLGLKYSQTPIVTINYNGSTYSNVYAGALSATLTPATGGALPNGYPSSFDTYCVDLNDDIHVPTSYSICMQPINGLTNGGGVAWLYDSYASQISDATHSAGLQIAIWKVLTDGQTTIDLNSGKFQYNTADQIATDANYYLQQWANSSYKTEDATWLVGGTYNNATHHAQDMIGPPVPEPGVQSLMGACMIGFTTFGWGLKKRRTVV